MTRDEAIARAAMRYLNEGKDGVLAAMGATLTADDPEDFEGIRWNLQEVVERIDTCLATLTSRIGGDL
jgi:hypothetical protein